MIIFKRYAKHLINLGVPVECLGFTSGAEEFGQKSLEQWPGRYIKQFLRNGEPLQFRGFTFGLELHFLLHGFSYLATSDLDPIPAKQQEKEKTHPVPHDQCLVADLQPSGGSDLFNHTQRVWDEYGNATLDYYRYYRF
jgi:hypothetical protein